ncbi:MAG TPA: hypothetical protein VEC57_15715 [Candidatus Limnocylindrales bacterium]|nr:hypothetical protein [Candidatus Limnocylindrales bacterium]
MKLREKLRIYRRVFQKASRNRADLRRVLAHHGKVAFAVYAYELAVLLSSKVDPRLKTLGAIKASALVGCPF